MEEEKRRLWKDVALMVPETLLLVVTSEGVLASISDACKLLDEGIWGVENTDDVESASHAAGGSEHSYGFGVLSASTCGGEHSIGFPLFTTLDGEQSHGSGFPFSTTFGGVHIVNSTGGERGFGFEVPLDTSCGGEHVFGSGVPVENTGGGDHDEIETSLDDRSAYDERIHGTLIDTGFDHWANLLASAFAPDGPFTAAHREITRLISLHGEAGHVLALCAPRLGLRHDGDPTWERRSMHRAAFLPNAHDALLRLGSAASATAAAEDFLRWRSPGSPRRKEWGWVARQLVSDARLGVLKAQDAVKLMRDAALHEFFETWAILKRA